MCATCGASYWDLRESGPPVGPGGGRWANTGLGVGPLRATGCSRDTSGGVPHGPAWANRKKGNPASGLGPSTYRDGLKAAETQKDQDLGATAFNRSKPMPREEEEDLEASVDPVANIGAS